MPVGYNQFLDFIAIMSIISNIGAWRRWLAHQLGVLGVVRSNRIAPISHLIFSGIAL